MGKLKEEGLFYSLNYQILFCIFSKERGINSCTAMRHTANVVRVVYKH